ncbi:MAG: hypothetical protein Q9162_007223 [Coniocarpon cinnabarinum]
MASHPHAWMMGFDRGQARSGQAPPPPFNNAWGDPSHPSPIAFHPLTFGQLQQHQQHPPLQQQHPHQHRQRQPHADLSLDTTRMSAIPFEPHHDNAVINNWAAAEEPWTGTQYTIPRLDTTVGQGSYHHHHQAFAKPRSPARSTSTASAMGPAIIDSAYGSTASPISHDPPTVGAEVSEMTSLFDKMPRTYSTTSEPRVKASASRRGTASVHSGVEDQPLVVPEDGKCPYCGRDFRLKSELKKHMLRHTRPFRCQIPECTGSAEGFTTSNDLDRHNRSVHSIFPKGAKVYICAAKDCAEGEKTWPRYDNFKQHCERMHKNQNLDTLIHKSERSAPPPAPEIQQYLTEYHKKPGGGRKRSIASEPSLAVREQPAPGYTNNMADAFYRNPFSESDATSLSGYRGGAVSDYGGERQIYYSARSARGLQGRRMGPGDNASLASGRMGSARTGGRNPQIVIHQEQQRQNESSHMTPTNTQMTESPVEFFHEPNEIPSHHRAQSTSQLLSPNVPRSRSISSQSSVASTSKNSRGRAATISGGDAVRSSAAGRKRKQESAASNPKRVHCKWPGCGKADMRPCELKSSYHHFPPPPTTSSAFSPRESITDTVSDRKHYRRHSRPFGCTFDYCYKAFGSKNDWKRHESSQHFQDEMWRCAQLCQPSAIADPASILTLAQSDCESSDACAQVFHERKELAEHLAVQHGFTDPDAIGQACSEQQIGRNLCGSFWCGFCKKVRVLENEGRKGWDERFDHIGGHFHPGNRNIKDWTPAMGNKTKGEILDEKQQENAAWDSESRSDEDAAGESEAATSVCEEAIVTTPVEVDAASFPSPGASFDTGVMNGIELAGMGTQNFTTTHVPPSHDMADTLSLDTAMTATVGTLPSGFVAHNGQLISPATSTGQESCHAHGVIPDAANRRNRFTTPVPPDPKFCCQCGDGPVDATLRGELQCLTCNHICEEGCEKFRY